LKWEAQLGADLGYSGVSGAACGEDRILGLMEKYDTGVTRHGDILLSFVSTADRSGLDPQHLHVICSKDAAMDIARLVLRAVATADPDAHA
jgi:hypothetical protein